MGKASRRKKAPRVRKQSPTPGRGSWTQADFAEQELVAEGVYADWLESGDPWARVILGEWEHLISLKPEHLKISERHEEFLVKLRTLPPLEGDSTSVTFPVCLESDSVGCGCGLPHMADMPPLASNVSMSMRPLPPE